jgi:hypothetical protein
VADCRIGDRGCTAIAQQLSSLVALESLDLSGNYIQDAGSEALARSLDYTSSTPPPSSALASSDCLSRPNHPSNPRSADHPGTHSSNAVGVGGVVQVRRVCPKLRQLDLERNHHIGDHGRRALVRITTLRPISVSLSFQFLFSKS